VLCAGVAVGRALGVAECVGPLAEVVVPAARELLLVWRPGDGLAELDGLADPNGLLPGLPGGVAARAWVTAAVPAVWLSRFMKPNTPTVLSRVARQVRVDSLRRPLSRCAPSRCRGLMGSTKPDNALSAHQERLKIALASAPQCDRSVAVARSALAAGVGFGFSLQVMARVD
jgi:hypothetical protein